jgi:3-hydroxyisobutyrate dehydrogenase-like beta-hydroxyacid dehydrogenase
MVCNVLVLLESDCWEALWPHACCSMALRPRATIHAPRKSRHYARKACALPSVAAAVFTILPTLDSVEAVVCGPGGLLETAARQTILIQMSTISPDLTHGPATLYGRG